MSSKFLLLQMVFKLDNNIMHVQLYLQMHKKRKKHVQANPKECKVSFSWKNTLMKYFNEVKWVCKLTQVDRAIGSNKS